MCSEASLGWIFMTTADLMTPKVFLLPSVLVDMDSNANLFIWDLETIQAVNKGCMILLIILVPTVWLWLNSAGGLWDPAWNTMGLFYPRGEGAGVFIHQLSRVFGWEPWECGWHFWPAMMVEIVDSMPREHHQAKKQQLAAKPDRML